MKPIKMLLPILLLLLFNACEKDDRREIKQQAEQMLNEAKSHLAANKDEYIRKIEIELAELDLQIKKLNEKAENAGARTRVEIEREVQELFKKREALQKNLDRLKSASAEAFKDAQSEIDNAMDDLKKSFEKTRSHFE